MPSLWDRLPQELVNVIFQFEGTKRELFKECLRELSLNRDIITAVSLTMLWWPAGRERRLRKVARMYRKKDLRNAAMFVGLRVHRTMTKYRIVLMIGATVDLNSLCYHLIQVL
jgi:hypothetical protein